MIELLIVAGAGLGGYRLARSFLIRKLRFVPSARSRFAPLVAGTGAALLTLPLSVLPLLTIGTSAAFGVGVAGGVYSGELSLRRREA